MNLVQVPEWGKYPWLRHGFSTRAGGVSTVYGGSSLNLGQTNEDDPALVAENRRRWLRSVVGPGSTEEQRLILLRQIHSTITHELRQDDLPENAQGHLLEGDGLITDMPGAALGILTADCVPVMVVDPAQRVVAVFHAGWRGTAGGIVEAGIMRMVEAFGSRPDNLIAAIGPSIGSCCYAVGDEVRSAFADRFAYAEQLSSNGRFDLWEANRRQMIDAGIPENQVTVIGQCTGCALGQDGERKYFSHRIDHGHTGRMMSVVCIAGS